MNSNRQFLSVFSDILNVFLKNPDRDVFFIKCSEKYHNVYFLITAKMLLIRGIHEKHCKNKDYFAEGEGAYGSKCRRRILCF